MLRRTLLALLGVALMQSASMANLINYAQNFDGLDVNSGTALSDDGWHYFNSAFNPIDGNYSYSGPAPNGPQISSVLSEFGGQHLNVYSDYNNTDAHGDNFAPVIVNVFQEQAFTTSDLGSTWSFNFDYAGAIENGSDFSPGGSTTTAAFIRVFDPTFSFLLDQQVLNTVNAIDAPNFNSGSLTQFIDPNWIDGGFMQFGFTNTATNFENSGIYYDNVRFTGVPEPGTAGLLAIGFGISLMRRRRM